MNENQKQTEIKINNRGKHNDNKCWYKLEE